MQYCDFKLNKSDKWKQIKKLRKNKIGYIKNEKY